jgi:hypothetical protein
VKTPQVRQRAKDALLTYIQGDRFTSNEQLTYYAAFRRDIDVPKQQQARKANIRTAGLDGFAEHLGMLVQNGTADDLNLFVVNTQATEFAGQHWFAVGVQISRAVAGTAQRSAVNDGDEIDLATQEGTEIVIAADRIAAAAAAAATGKRGADRAATAAAKAKHRASMAAAKKAQQQEAAAAKAKRRASMAAAMKAQQREAAAAKAAARAAGAKDVAVQLAAARAVASKRHKDEVPSPQRGRARTVPGNLLTACMVTAGIFMLVHQVYPTHACCLSKDILRLAERLMHRCR